MKLILLAALLTTSCAAARSPATGAFLIYFWDGGVETGVDYYEPQVEGDAVLFKKEGAFVLIPLIRIFKAYWAEEDVLRAEIRKGEKRSWLLDSSKQ